jgi:hypothetical protein
VRNAVQHTRNARRGLFFPRFPRTTPEGDPVTTKGLG